jgi:hypothetical protein
MKKILIITGAFLIVVCAIVFVTWRQQNTAASGPCWHMLLSWPEGITGWAIIATLIVIGWQSYETARSADIANRTLLSTMRPRLIVRHISIHRGTKISTIGVPDADPWRIDFDVVNVGQSTARIKQHNFTSNRIEDDIPDFAVEEKSSVSLSLEPGQKRTMSIELNQQLKEILRLIGPDGLTQGYQNTNRLYFWGHAQYVDGLGIVRNIAVCRRYENNVGRFMPGIDPDFEYAD